MNEVALGEQKGIVAIFIYTVICFFMIIQNVALIVRRLHDIGLSAWWIFLFLILTLPIAYPVIFLMFFMILLSGLSKHDLLILLLAIYIESLVTVMIVGLQEGKLINNQYRQEEINTQ